MRKLQRGVPLEAVRQGAALRRASWCIKVTFLSGGLFRSAYTSLLKMQSRSSTKRFVFLRAMSAPRRYLRRTAILNGEARPYTAYRARPRLRPG